MWPREMTLHEKVYLKKNRCSNEYGGSSYESSLVLSGTASEVQEAQRKSDEQLNLADETLQHIVLNSSSDDIELAEFRQLLAK